MEQEWSILVQFSFAVRPSQEEQKVERLHQHDEYDAQMASSPNAIPRQASPAPKY